MTYEAFTDAWAQAWARQLNRNETYKKAAAKWEWPVIMVLEKDEREGVNEDRRLYADLWRGECREARACNDAELENAPYVISGAPQNWKKIFYGELDPMLALMRGKLKLKKGSMFVLARYGAAAKQLVLAAAQTPTHFPGEGAIAAPAASKNGASQNVFVRTGFKTNERGLRRDSFPMRLFQKAKKYGVWDPNDIDFSKDIADWRGLDDLEKEVILQQTALFQAGEESVTEDILPLILTVAREGRLEEEIYLTSFLWEEAKHVDFFDRFLREVVQHTGDLSRFHVPSYSTIFYDRLPNAMNALLTDPSPAAQVRASVIYNMIAEGMLAETGYYSYFKTLEENDLLPGLREGVGLIKRDESRHIAYGIYFLSRLISADPSLWKVLEETMAELLEPALEIINETFSRYEVIPFGMKQEDYLEYAMDQFNKRMTRLERARNQSIEDVEQEAEKELI